MSSYSGGCNCGAIAFDVDASSLKFNAFCHCRACARARGASPAHLIGVAPSQFVITKGKSNVKLCKGMGSMVQALCSDCGCHIYQHPGGEDFTDFRALFPVNFHIETDDSSLPCGKSCKLPDELMPTNHINYENRVMDVHDALPKYTAFGPPFVEGERVNNDGSKYEG